MTKDFRIAIIGGGICGLAMAISLHKRNINATLYERTNHFRDIGAGFAMAQNGMEAMAICAEQILTASARVENRNGWESKADVFFDYFDVTASSDVPFLTIRTTTGQRGLKRSQFMDELVKLFPAETVRFGKKLDHIVEGDGGKLMLQFGDGTTANADAVIGCDGIHSQVRKILIGNDHPAANPVYTHKCAYRGLVPMEEAVAAIGDERARNSCAYFGSGGRLLTYTVNDGKTMNVIAYKSDPNDWLDSEKQTRWATRDEAVKEFQGYGPVISKVMGLVAPELNVWGIFDLYNPLPYFASGRVAVAGDAAHAASPHQGAGAGFAMEDVACLSELLNCDAVTNTRDLEVVLSVYDAHRRERGNWLVQSSRWVGRLYDYEFGNNYEMIERQLRERFGMINNFSVREMCDRALGDLRERLA
ncbi:FAD/NAD(P)-binding domain-containing protein [Thozetella sp. PMI_491]|nr:FAD/NAD(P)-binding domain-containing protein [Thozetella sp. PMI_491]